MPNDAPALDGGREDLPLSPFVDRLRTSHAFALVAVERERRHQQWGVQRHDFPVWLTVLTEEVGELAQEILRFRQHRFNEGRYGANEATKMVGRDRLVSMRTEAVQVAAVAVAMIEHIDSVIERQTEESP